MFAGLWGSQVISLLGSAAAAIAVSLAVFERTGSGTLLALIVAIRYAATIYLAPIAGAIADRFRRRSAVLACDALLCASSLLLALSLSRDWIWAVLVLVGIGGALSSALTTTLSASIKPLYPDRDLTGINAVVSILDNAPMIAGPFLGTFLYLAFGAELVLVVDAASFLVGLIVVACLPHWGEQPARSDAGRRSMSLFQDAVGGIRWITSRPGLLRLQLGFTIVNFVNGLAASLIPAYILIGVAYGEWSLSAYNAASSLGLIVSAAAVLLLHRRLGRRRLIALSVTASGLFGRVLLGATTLSWTVVLSGFFRGVYLQSSNTPLSAIWQEVVPAQRQAAVFGARRLLGQGLYPIAALSSAFLAPLVGANVPHETTGPVWRMGVLFIICGLVECCVGAYLLWSEKVVIPAPPRSGSSGSGQRVASHPGTPEPAPPVAPSHGAHPQTLDPGLGQQSTSPQPPTQATSA